MAQPAVAALFKRRSAAVMLQLDMVVDLCEAQLQHSESYVYQAALNALEAAASAAPSRVLPRLAQLLLPPSSSTKGVPQTPSPLPQPPLPHITALSLQAVLRTRARLAAEDAGEAPTEGDGVDLGGMAQGTEGDGVDLGGMEKGAREDNETLDAPTERRLKAAQAICQAVRRLGETLPPHAEAVMGALLVGVCDPCAAVRHSCLGGLADVAATLRLALHPWAVELLQVTGAALEGETDAAARSAACYLLGLLLQSLGTDALTVLSPRQLAAIYRRLKILRGGAAQADPKLLGHVDAALEQMRQLGLVLVRGGSSLENDPVLWGSEQGQSTMEPEGILRSIGRLRLFLA